MMTQFESFSFTCGLKNGSVRILDLTQMKPTTEFEGHQAPIRDWCFFRNGTQLASVTRGVLKNRVYVGDQTIRLWSLSTEKEVAQLAPGGGSIRSIDIIGTMAVTAQGNRRIYMWMLPLPQKPR